jgi:hypothetical protein
MAFKIYEVVARARMTSGTNDDPRLVASASGATAVLETLTVNGVEVALAGMGTTEKATLTAALKAAVVDKLDLVVPATGTADGGNTGNGTVTVVTANGLTAVAETWTISFLTATTYTVTGSVTGATANGNSAVAAGVYNNGYIQFTVTAGVTPFVLGDEFTIAIALE